MESRVTTPLAFLWKRDVLPVVVGRDGAVGDAERRAFETQVERWLSAGRDVLFLAGEQQPSPYLAEGPAWREVSRIDFRIETMSSGVATPPRHPNVFTETYHLLRAFPRGTIEPCAPRGVTATAPLLGRAEGMYASEWNGEERFRWTAPESRIRTPTCDRTGEGRPDRLRVRAGCWRDPSAADCRVSVRVNRHPAGTIALGRRLSDHVLKVPRQSVDEESGPVEIEFRGPSFVPSEHGFTGDSRQLSFQLGEVTLQPAPTR